MDTETLELNAKVDIVIPVYKPDDKFNKTLGRLISQTVKPAHIYLLQTVEDDNEKLLNSKDECISVHPVKKREFDHGATRRMGAQLSQNEYVMFMTQDAIPDNDEMIANLLKAFDDDKVAIAYGRQLAGEDADILERMARLHNYPDASIVKTKEDLDRLGIKTYFCSDVCAMYRKKIYNELGGFVKKTIFNEDMIMASKVIKAEYSVAYCADARVVHSHSYTCRQQFVRNFDLGVSQKQYKEVFQNISSEKEGAGFAKHTLGYLLKRGRVFKAFYFAVQCGFRLIGYKLGLHYDKLPKSIIMKCTMNKGYWL